jgi:predicted Zn-dependent peptidase
MENLEIINLSNGIRVVYKQVPTTQTVHCGFILNVGSRDERPQEKGLAHFWEHMAFKGTRKRRAFHIINSIDSVGGELNAYTTKEKICFYASVLSRHFERATELLTDITFDSIFPENHIEKERNVILEEMAMYRDTPEDAIQDDFEDQLFAGHPLGHNILGSEDSVKSFHKKDFQDFIIRNMNTTEVIFSVVGNVRRVQLQRLIKKYLEPIPALVSERSREPFKGYQQQNHEVTKPIHQAQIAIGGPGLPLNHEDRIKLFVICNILGGPFMNSRLNLALREKYGYVYHVEIQQSSYSDTGAVSIFYGTEPAQIQKSIKVVKQELLKLQNRPMGSIQLHRAKEQIIGQLAMAEENYAALMLTFGKSLLDKGTIESFESLVEQIRNVEAPDIQQMAERFFNPTQLSSLIFTVN